MQRTNYRCVESLNISVEVAKCGKYSQIYPVHSLFVCYKKWLILPEQSIHGKLSTHKDVLLLWPFIIDRHIVHIVYQINKSPLCCYMYLCESHSLCSVMFVSSVCFCYSINLYPYACQNTIAHQSEPDSTRHNTGDESQLVSDGKNSARSYEGVWPRQRKLDRVLRAVAALLQCISRQMWKNFTYSPSTLTICL